MKKAKTRAFLRAYRQTGSITQAAADAFVNRSAHYEWMRESAEYREEFFAAQEDAAGLLEDEARERATRGVYEPLVYQGEFTFPSAQDPETGEWSKDTRQPLGVWKKSDALLMFLLRGALPGKYTTRVVAEHSGPQGGPIPLEQKRLAVLNDDELAQLIAVASKLATAGTPEGGGDAPGAP